MEQIFTVLAYLEQNAIAHRDVKPENIILSNNGTIKLIDFGISRKLPSNLSMSVSIGTREFAAPE